MDGFQDFPSDDPNQWYELSALYCRECRHFEFCGMGGDSDQPLPLPPKALENGALMTASDHALAYISMSPDGISATQEASAPDASFEVELNEVEQNAGSEIHANDTEKSIIGKYTRSVKRRHCVKKPTLCCLPESERGVHFRCPNAPTSTRTLKARGCRRCNAGPPSIELVRICVQQGEIQYGLDSFSNMPSGLDDISHSILLCQSCRAIGFPGVNGRLTLLTTGSQKYAHSFTCSSEIPFYDTVSEKGLHSSAWQNAFGHVPGSPCIYEKGPLTSLPIRLHKSSLEFAKKALPHSIPMTCRAMAKLQSEAQVLKCKLQFSDCQSRIASASTPEELGKTLTQLTEFALQLQIPHAEVFGCSATIMRQRLCDTMKRKRVVFQRFSNSCWDTKENVTPWPRDTAKRFGVLLRVFNTLCDEERIELQLQDNTDPSCKKLETHSDL